MKTFFGFLYHLVGLMAGAGGLMAFVVGLIVAWDKNHYLAVSIFLVAVISALVVTIYSQKLWSDALFFFELFIDFIVKVGGIYAFFSAMEIIRDNQPISAILIFLLVIIWVLIKLFFLKNHETISWFNATNSR